MADSPRHPDAKGDAGRGPVGGTPRWVKVSGVIAIVVVLILVVMLVTRGPGGHGPGRHTSLPAAATYRAPRL